MFNPSTDIPALTDKVILVTGGTAGLGRLTVTTLAAHGPAHIFFTGRSHSRAEGVIADAGKANPRVPVTFISCDLASLASVKAAATDFLKQARRLDILVCNAGIMAVPAATTVDGYEIHFGTNVLGHAMLIHELLPALLETAAKPDSDVRVISNTSTGFNYAPPGGILFDSIKSSQDLGIGGRWKRYGESKLGNILYMAELARHYSGLTCTAVHPGVINTELVSGLSYVDQAVITMTNIGKMVTAEEGVKNQLWAATAPKDAIVSGEFYEPVGKPGVHSADSKDEMLAKKLWDWTQRELEIFSAKA